MTVRKKNSETLPERTKILLSTDDFKERLTKRLQVGQELIDRKVDRLSEIEIFIKDFGDWDNYNSEFLKSSFDRPTNEYKQSYDSCTQIIGMDDYVAGRYKPNDPNYELRSKKLYAEAKHNNLRLLLAKADLIPTTFEQTEQINIEETEVLNKNIFIIHGHDETRLLELENLLNNDFKLTPFVLKNLANIGSSTLIEKFEFYANQCSMAIALFTPDDIIEKDGKQYLQARPNVIYELGWFCAKLTRKNVILLLKDGTDIFSDFQGIVQIKFKQQIVDKYRELLIEFKAKGLV